jgi:glycosyltransferase involved in cell wall biosynthesis
VRISVIIPARNEEHTITPLLDRLKSQTLPPAEIIVADGGSTDKTPEIVEAHGRGPLAIHLVRGGEGFPGRNRNLGAARALNDWIAFIDAGVVPEPNWLESLARVAESSPSPDVVYGSFAPVSETLFEECAAIAFVPPPKTTDGELVRTRSIASALMRRSVWQAVGGFPEDLRSAEDLLFMDKIDAASFRIALAPRALVHWSLEPTLWKTLRRFITYSHNNIRAGLWRSWQAKIFQRYALLILLALPAIFLGPIWLLVPLLLWVLMLLARAAIALRRNAVCYPAAGLRQLSRLAVISVVLAAIDFAAIAGSIKWLVADRSFSAPTRSVDHGA